jgi:hypothetical protein
LDWGLGIVLVYMFLFRIGKIILGDLVTGVIYCAIGFAGMDNIGNINYLGWGEKIRI